jgi:hypothetical protein
MYDRLDINISMVKKVSNRMNIETFAQKMAQEEDAGTRAINDKYGVPTKEDFDFKIKNDGTGVPTEIVKKEPSTSEVLMAGFKEEQAARKKEEEEEQEEEKKTKFKKKYGYTLATPEEEDSKFLDDIANNTPNSGMFDHFEDEVLEEKNEVIDINNYERYWDNSTPNGHQIRILKQDNSTLTINLEWPKGYNPRLREVKKR